MVGLEHKCKGLAILTNYLQLLFYMWLK